MQRHLDEEKGNKLVEGFAFHQALIGYFGFFLPPTLYFVTKVFWGEENTPGSISAYYHTRAVALFVGVMWSVGVFMISYKGYSKRRPEELDGWFPRFRDMISDSATATVAGLSAIGLACMPTKGAGLAYPYIEELNALHYVCTFLFFLMLVYMAGFKFTLSDCSGKLPPRKARRNAIYIACALVMAVCLAWILIVSWSERDLPPGQGTSKLVAESLAVMSFGAAWLVKSGTVPGLRDAKKTA